VSNKRGQWRGKLILRVDFLGRGARDSGPVSWTQKREKERPLSIEGRWQRETRIE